MFEEQSPALLPDIEEFFASFEDTSSILELDQVDSKLAQLDNELAAELLGGPTTYVNGFDASLLHSSSVAELVTLFRSNPVALKSGIEIINMVDNGFWVDQQPVPVHPKKQRGPKQDFPAHLKDTKYYQKRTNNTKAARRSRKRAKLRKALEQAATKTGVNGDTAKEQVAEIKKTTLFHRTLSTTTV
jgi:hypothetical protein